jgi:sugar fermentation stimulation protein A
VTEQPAGRVPFKTAGAHLRTTYILITYLPQKRTIKVGRLGRIHFEAGLYFYVGSGGRSPGKRLARHASKRKRKFWHIDYLTVNSSVIGALVFEHETSLECELAGALAGAFAPVPGFGASDCKCRSHLFRSKLPGAK